MEMVESSNDIFFEIGYTQLKSPAVRLLENIGSRLKDLSYKVIVEGHADARPCPGLMPNCTNCELGAGRANSARRALTHGGVQMGQIDEICGCADSRLRNRDDPLDAVNRRISVTVKFTSEP